jgi:hypothetical protein
MTPTEELTRAGLVETRPGVFEKVPHAKRTVSETKAADVESERSNPVVQEQQNSNSEVSEWKAAGSPLDDNQARVPENHGQDHGVFRLSVVVRVSDRRRRDLDGILSTLCDCLIRARRRLLDPHTRDSHSSGNGAAGAGGRNNRSRKTVKFKATLPPPF